MNIDETKIEDAITDRTKVIVPVHYAGVACEMDKIMDIARRHHLLVVEDAAQGVMAKYKGKDLGAIGDYGCYSFHETKNYSMGEGGATLIRDPENIERAEIFRRTSNAPRSSARRERTGASSSAGRSTSTPGSTTVHRIFRASLTPPICMRSWSARMRSIGRGLQGGISIMRCLLLLPRKGGSLFRSFRRGACIMRICFTSRQRT